MLRHDPEAICLRNGGDVFTFPGLLGHADAETTRIHCEGRRDNVPAGRVER